MFKSITLFVKTNPFVRDSSYFYIINILVGLLNYIMIIVVSHHLAGELSSWTALSSWILLIFTFLKGLVTPIGKTISAYSLENQKYVQSYFSFIQKNFFWINLTLSSLPLLIWFIFTGFGYKSSWEIYLLISFVIYSHLSISVNSQFLLGVLNTSRSAQITLISGIARFVFTMILIYLGFGLYALFLGYILSYFSVFIIIKKYVSSHVYDVNQEEKKFTLSAHLQDSMKVLLSMLLLALILNMDVILADFFMPKNQADLFAVLSNFGQIIFFGSTAFMNAFIVYIVRSKDLRAYLQTLSAVTFFGVCAGIFLWLFADQAFSLFNRPEYLGKSGLIALYSVFITLYNIVFVSINFLISKSCYLEVAWCSLFVLLQVVLLSWLGSTDFQSYGSPVEQYIWVNIIITILVSGFLVFSIWRKFGFQLVGSETASSL